MRRTTLQHEIDALEAKLPGGRVAEQLDQVRRGLGNGSQRAPAIELPNLRMGFECKERWEAMVGDDRVRACAGCDRPVFDLSEMTLEEVRQLLATRGLKPCVRFYRRPDGTVMTADCPTGERRDKRRLAVVASSIAAGTAIASPASAQPLPEQETTAPEPVEVAGETIEISSTVPELQYGSVTLGELIWDEPERPLIESSIWGRVGAGVSSTSPSAVARSSTPVERDASGSTWEAALAADITVGIARKGTVRAGIWGEVRTTTDPVIGATLVVDGLPARAFDYRIRNSMSIVLRAGGNADVITGALGIGVIGSWGGESWNRLPGHVVGARVVASFNRVRDDPSDWSAILGLELEPIGALRAVIHVVKPNW